MQNLTLPPQYQFMSMNGDAFGQTEVTIQVGIIDHNDLTDDVYSRLDTLTTALGSCARWVHVNRQMSLIEYWIEDVHKFAPNKLVFTVTYDADDHDAIMEALKPFDDLWEKA